MKAVIPVAGLGTRMLPATKAIPKEMLPIVDKPLIQYVVEEAIAAGIKEIILVTHSSKNSIENHFDKSFELEATLEARVKRQLLTEIQSICPADVSIMQVRQGQAKGLGHAIACAQPLVGEQAFAVLLPDVMIDHGHCQPQQDNLADMLIRYRANGCAQVMVESVALDKVNQYGIADCLGAKIQAGDSCPMHAIVEKPSLGRAPSNLAVVGRYVLPPSIWPILQQTQPGAGGEIQLTDAIATLMQKHTVEAYAMIGKSHDCGDKIGYMLANLEYALRHPQVGCHMRSTMLKLLQQRTAET